MSDNNDISRRKALTATGGIGGTILGVPAVAAGESDGSSDRSEEERGLTEDEVGRALAETPVVVGPKANGHDKPEEARGPNLSESDVPDDADIFIGENQNAEVPAEKPYTIETFDEWLERDAPPGFDTTEENEFGIQSIPQLYFQEDLGTVSLAGYSTSVGIGVGIRGGYSGIVPGASVSVSFDIYVGGVSFSLFSQSVEVGVTEEGLCFDRLNLDYSYIPELMASGCIDIGITTGGGGDVSVHGGVTFDLCANPCPIGNCSVCHGVSGVISYP